MSNKKMTDVDYTSSPVDKAGRKSNSKPQYLSHLLLLNFHKGQMPQHL